MDSDDSNDDPHYNPAKDEQFDGESISDSLEEQGLNDLNVNVAECISDDGVLSELGYDPIETEISVVYPQLCSEKILTSQTSGKTLEEN